MAQNHRSEQAPGTVVVQAWDIAGQPAQYWISAVFESADQAATFTASLPKATARTTWDNAQRDFVQIMIDGKLQADGANGGRNEAGIRRYRSFVAAARAMGFAVSIETDVMGSQAWATIEAFERAAGI